VADLRAPTPSAAAELLVVEKEMLQARIHEIQGRLLSAVTGTLGRLQKKMEGVVRRMRDPRRRVADFWMRLDELSTRLGRSAGAMIRERRGRLKAELRAFFLNAPVQRIGLIRQRIGYQNRSMVLQMSGRLKSFRMDLSLKAAKLNDVSPFTILAKGFSITRKLPEGKVLNNASGVTEGNRVRVTLARGELECVVEKVDPTKSCTERVENCLQKKE
jgi:exodeoxyribonuclease VII large subunit